MTLAAKAWLRWGYAHLLVAAALGLAQAAPSSLFPIFAPMLVAMAGVFLVAAGCAYALAPAFTRREVGSDTPAQLVLALVLAGTAMGLALAALKKGDPQRAMTLLYGAAFVALPLHLAWIAVAGKRWAGGVDIYAPDEPFRRGDLVAASALAAGLAALAGAGALLLIQPRHVPTSGITVFVTAFTFPFFSGLLAFVAPRAAKRALSGATILGVALFFVVLASAFLGLGILLYPKVDFRYPSAGLLAGLALGVVGLGRATLPPSAIAARHALRFGAALALLAGIGVLLVSRNGGPLSPLFVPASYALVVTALPLATGVVLLAAPLLELGDAAPRRGWWAAIAGALLVAGVLLLSSALEYARAPFPAAVVLAIGAALVAWGVTPRLR